MRFCFAAEKFAQFVTNNFYYLLVGRKLQEDFGTQRLFTDVLDELVRNADVYVAFEQGFANFHQARIEMFLGDFALAAQILEGALELVCQCFKHGGFRAERLVEEMIALSDSGPG